MDIYTVSTMLLQEISRITYNEDHVSDDEVARRIITEVTDFLQIVALEYEYATGNNLFDIVEDFEEYQSKGV